MNYKIMSTTILSVSEFSNPNFYYLKNLKYSILYGIQNLHNRRDIAKLYSTKP